MPIYIEAIYENGRFRPLEPVALEEGQKVSLVVQSVPAKHLSPAEYVQLAQKVYAGLTDEEIAEIEAIALERCRRR